MRNIVLAHAHRFGLRMYDAVRQLAGHTSHTTFYGVYVKFSTKAPIYGGCVDSQIGAGE
jgi:hypothetical protein